MRARFRRRASPRLDARWAILFISLALVVLCPFLAASFPHPTVQACAWAGIGLALLAGIPSGLLVLLDRHPLASPAPVLIERPPLPDPLVEPVRELHIQPAANDSNTWREGI